MDCAVDCAVVPLVDDPGLVVVVRPEPADSEPLLSPTPSSGTPVGRGPTSGSPTASVGNSGRWGPVATPSTSVPEVPSETLWTTAPTPMLDTPMAANTATALRAPRVARILRPRAATRANISSREVATGHWSSTIGAHPLGAHHRTEPNPQSGKTAMQVGLDRPG